MNKEAGEIYVIKGYSMYNVVCGDRKHSIDNVYSYFFVKCVKCNKIRGSYRVDVLYEEIKQSGWKCNENTQDMICPECAETVEEK